MSTKEDYFFVDRLGAIDSGKFGLSLSRPYISIYPDSVWWNFQSSGMLNWISFKCKFTCWGIMCGMNNFPSYQVRQVAFTIIVITLPFAPSEGINFRLCSEYVL